LLPRAASKPIVEALRGSGRGTSDRSSFPAKALLVVQATLSVVLVAGATMLGPQLETKLDTSGFRYSGAKAASEVDINSRQPPTRNPD